MNSLPVYFINLVVIIGLLSTRCFAQSGDAALTGDSAAQSRLAQAYIHQKNYAQALRIYDRLLKEFPDNTRMYYLRGVLRHALGRSDEAKSDYEFLVNRDAADSIIYNNLGVIYVANNEYDQAQQWFTRAAEEDPGIAEVHDNLAELFMQKKAYGDAISEYNKVIKIEQDNVRALYNLGVMYVKVGDYTSARRQWEKVLAINPYDTNVKKILEQTKQQRASDVKEN